MNVGSSLAAAGAAGLLSFATGEVVPLAGSSACPAGRGLATGAGVFSSAFFCSGCGAAFGGAACFGSAFAGSAFGAGFSSVFVAAAVV